MLFRSFCFGALIIGVLCLNGCVSSKTYNTKYQKSQSIPPMFILKGVSSASIHNYYSIPSVDKTAPEGSPDLFPPGVKRDS